MLIVVAVIDPTVGAWAAIVPNLAVVLDAWGRRVEADLRR